MNIIDFFKDLATNWNENGKCSFCWSFSAPLSESGMNATENTEANKCCVHIFITYYKTSASYTKNQNTGQKNREWCDHIFTAYFVKSSDISLNVYNEQPFYPITESLWETHLKPLQNCLGNGNEIDFCELNYEFEISKWEMEVVKKYEDSNYTGWKVNGIIRENF